MHHQHRTGRKLVAILAELGISIVKGGDGDLKVDDVKSDLRTMRKTLGELVKEGDRLAIAIKIDDEGRVEVPAELADDMRANEEKRSALVGHIKRMEELVTEHEYLGAKEGTTFGQLAAPGGVAGAAAAFVASGGGMVRKTVGWQYAESKAFQDYLTSGAAQGLVGQDPVPFAVPGGFKDIYSQLAAAATGQGTFPSPVPFGQVYRDDPVSLAHRKVFLRDLLNVVTTDATVFEFFRETGYVNAASTVGERSGTAFTLKPRSNITFEYAVQQLKTLAHGIVVHRNTLADNNQVADLIDSELIYGLQLLEDQQILYGNQTIDPQNLWGIFNDPGIQTYNKTTGLTAAGGAPPNTDNDLDALRRAITKVLVTNRQPDGVAVSPIDFETMELTKDTIGNYLMAVSIALGAEERVWRLPVVQSTALSHGDAVVAAWKLALKLFDREEANIKVFEQHSDLAERNAVYLRAEERVALTVRVPEAIVHVTGL